MKEQMIIFRAIILFVVLNYHYFFNLAAKLLNQYSFPAGLILTVAVYT